MTRIFLFMTLILTMAAFKPALAQEVDEDTPAIGQLDKTKSLNPDAPLSNEATEKIYKQCRGVFPLRFTPGALDYYCSCSAAATQGVMTSGEYESIQLPKNRKGSNPVFAKYVTQVVTPCMDAPTLDIEYYACVLNRSNSRDVQNVISYCKCVSEELSKHVQKYGDTDAMSRLDQMGISDPMEAMWTSLPYKKAVVSANESCRRPNLKPPSVYN